MAFYRLGVALDISGRPNEAIEPLREALRLLPDQPAPMNNVAWILATCPDPARRDPGKALVLASGRPNSPGNATRRCLKVGVGRICNPSISSAGTDCKSVLQK